MNILDMHTREKANQVHIAELQRAAQAHYPSPGLGGIPAVSGRGVRLMLRGAVLVLLAGMLLISATVFLILSNLH